MKTQKQKGFTLIELLVVVAIIGVLASIVLSSLGEARGRARDARRLNDVRQIQTALEMYNIDNNRYPSPISANGSWETSNEDNADFITILSDDGYISVVPVDPINTVSNAYYYYRYSAGGSECDVRRGAFYILGIKNMEGGGVNSYSSSPGFSCPSRNWQGEFDWVIGKFEKG
jgi:type II secretion system protein G